MPNSIKPPVPEDFHALYDTGARALRGMPPARAAAPETPGHRRLRASVPELNVEYDATTGVPVHVSSRSAGATLTAPAPSAEDAAARFVKEQGDLWELSPDDAATVEVRAVSRQGLYTVRLVQKVDGVDVFNSDVTLAVDRNNQVLSSSGQFFAGAAAQRGAARRAAAPAALPAEEAIARAASDLTGAAFTAADFVPAPQARASGSYRFYDPAPPAPGRAGAPPEMVRPVRVKDVMFPLGDGTFVPAYYIELWPKDLPAFAYVVDTVGTPDILYRKNLTSQAAFKYRVFNNGDAPLFRPTDGPAPGTPHPTGVPDGFQAAKIESKLIELESLLPGRPWLPDGATVLRGNNCFAYADLASPDGFSSGDVAVENTAQGTFDYPYDHSEPASNGHNLRSSLVGMF
jgi:hypothetical protein